MLLKPLSVDSVMVTAKKDGLLHLAHNPNSSLRDFCLEKLLLELSVVVISFFVTITSAKQQHLDKHERLRRLNKNISTTVSTEALQKSFKMNSRFRASKKPSGLKRNRHPQTLKTRHKQIDANGSSSPTSTSNTETSLSTC